MTMAKKTKFKPGGLTPVQKFVVERLHRSKIKNAKYNPRQIDDYARKKLRVNLEKMGLLDPLVWNRVTGNLVSGHQRIQLVDAITGTDDYVMDFSVVELTAQEEKTQNVFFNNKDTQGTYDVDRLLKMIADEEIDYREAGFDDMTIQVMAEETDYEISMHDGDDAPASVKDDLEQLREIQRMKRERKEHRERDQEENDPEFYAVLVFPDRDAQSDFMERVGVDRSERYVDGVRVHTSLEAAKPRTKTTNDGEFEAMTFWVAKDQKPIIEDEIVRIGALLKGKNLRGRALEYMAVNSAQTPTENLTGESDVQAKPKFKTKKRTT